MIRLYLIIAGIVAMAIGTMILFAPVVFYAGYGLDLARQVTLLNELRSHGFAMLGAGLFIAGGVFVPHLVRASTMAAALFYLSYGLSRLVGVAFDGLPADSMTLAGAIELILGLVGLGLIVWSRRLAPAR